MEPTLDRFFASSWHVVSGGFGGPHRPDRGLKRWCVAWHVLRRFALDPRMLSAGLLVSGAIYFTDSWKGNCADVDSSKPTITTEKSLAQRIGEL